MRLLVIEDYDPLRRSLVQGLTESGYAVDATGDGREGLWYASDAAYDAVVLDLMLPSLDGMSILERMRKAGSESPVLILSAKGELDDRLAGFKRGADDYLVKPFAFEELLARVNALVRRRNGVHASVIELENLIVDLDARTVSWNGNAVALTALEFSLIEVLALNHGRVVTRTQITEHIYGFDEEPNSNAINVHIAQLRRKLEAPNQPTLIHTRRGMGYMLGLAEA